MATSTEITRDWCRLAAFRMPYGPTAGQPDGRRRLPYQLGDGGGLHHNREIARWPRGGLENKNTVGRWPYSYTGYWRALQEVAHPAGLGGIVTHSFRQSVVRHSSARTCAILLECGSNARFDWNPIADHAFVEVTCLCVVTGDVKV